MAEPQKPLYFCPSKPPRRAQKTKEMTQIKLFNHIPKADGGASILLYGDVGSWGDITAERVATELHTLEGQYSSIDVRINSVGGDVFTGIAIYNALRASKANIRIYVDGLAASIAGVIALCGKPLYMSQYARLMLHKVSGGAYGSAQDLRQTAELIESLEDSLAEMIAERIKMTKQDVHATYFADGQDHWMTAREALERGFIDAIHDLPEEPSLDEQSTTDDIYKVFNNRLCHEALNPTNQDMALLDQIKAVAGFADVTEASLVARLQNQATKMEAQEQTITELQAKLKDYETRELENILDVAIADGRITNEQRPTFLALLESDRANTQKLLNELPKPKPILSARHYVQSGGGTTPSNSQETSVYKGKSWDELDKADMLASFKAQDPEGFRAAFQAHYGVEYKD